MSDVSLQEPEAGVSTRDAMLSIGGFWIVWLALVSARAAAMGWQDQGGMLLRRLAMAGLGVALAFVVHRLLHTLRRWPLGARAAAAFILSVPATLVFAVVNTMVFYRWFPVPSVAADLARWGPHAVVVTATADGLVTWYFFFAAWAAFYLALGFVGQVRASERAKARAEAASDTATLAMLRMQVDPHFLFNALNALSSLVARGRDEAAGAMIRDLAAFFRAGLSADPAADVTLGEEMENQRLYLAVERARFGDRLNVTIATPERLGAAKVPALILQPLVENAVKHALVATSAPVRIEITADASADEMRIAIVDRTAGERARGTAPASTGIGLANVRARLATRYGGRARLDARPSDGGWTSEIRLPVTKAHDL